ncbi:hypothetical protein [Kiloniella sp.]|uniref:hypothetical protein n=1 Tax=Kiloniella sp. TaxID=1938587 RepID=UPI003B02DDDF
MQPYPPYTYVWEFIVRDGVNAEFEKLYGPEGDWVKLFRLGTGYLKTELMRDQANPQRYLTLDYWQSYDQYLKFKREFGAEYASLDAKCEGLTCEEREIGEFSINS